MLQHYDILGSYQRGKQFKSQNAMNDLALQQAQNQMQTQEGIRNTMATMGSNPGREDIAKLNQFGQPGMAAAQDLQSIYSKLSTEEQQVELKRAMDVGNTLRGVQTPEQYQVALQEIGRLAPNAVQHLPQQFDQNTPQIIQGYLNRIDGLSKQAGIPSGIQDRNDLMRRLPVDNDGKLRPENTWNAQERAAVIESGMAPRAVGSAAITTATQGLTQPVAASEGVIAGEKSLRSEEGKLDAQGRLLPDVEKQKQLAKDAGNLSTEMFTRMEGVEGNIRNLEEGIRLIDAGANTGPIDKWFPSFKASTVALDNLKNRLGLDVIGSVTFGALSEGELRLALDTAIPPNLNGPELKAWFQERIEPQKKLLAALEDAAIFLAEDGATIPKLMAKRREERRASRGDPRETKTAQNIQEGQTATNPQTGERIIFTNGQWQPAP